MNRRCVLVALFFAASLSLHARDLRPELVVEGRVQEISLSPAGHLWIGTAMGRAYRSDDGGRSWAEAAVPVRRVDYDAKVFIGDHVDRVTFFDERRAILSGYIGESHDRVLLTDDAGATWKAVPLPAQNDPMQGLWVYDAQTTSDGHAWLVGSSGAVLRSDDFGRTWRELARPFDEDERTLSVWFDSPALGVVGALFSGDVAITEDGGASWRKFEAASREQVVSGCRDERDRRVTKARISGGRVIVAQCGGVFASPIDAPRAWTRVTAGGRPLVDFETADGGRLIGVTDDRNVYENGHPLGMRLEHPVVSIATYGKRIALLDSTLEVAVFDGDTWHASRMFGKGVATSWPIATLDRGAEDVLWGISRFFLYRSTDGAKTWDRIAELPAAADRVLLQSDGNVLLSDGHGWVGRWDVQAKTLAAVPVLNGLDIAGAFRRRDLWLVFGGRQYDTAGRVEVAQSFFSGQFAGSVDFGFVAASTDGGRTWSVIDRWKEEGPQAIFLSDDNRLTLLSWLCGIRQGRLELDPLGAKMETLFPGSDRKRAPYVQNAMVLDLLGGNRGWIVGWIHHIGNRVFRTTDGGRSWKRADDKAYPRVRLYRLFDGTWIGFDPPSTLQRWTGKKFERLTSTPEDVNLALIDSQGSLLLRSEDGTVRVLDAGRGTLRTLRQRD